MKNEEREFEVYIVGTLDTSRIGSQTIRFRLARAKDEVEEKYEYELPPGHFFPIAQRSSNPRYCAGKLYFKVIILGRYHNPDFFVGFISDDNIREPGLKHCSYLFEVSSLAWPADKAKFDDWLQDKPMYAAADELLVRNRLPT